MSGRIALGAHATRDDVAGMPTLLGGEGAFLRLQRIVVVPVGAARGEDVLVDRVVLPGRLSGDRAALAEIVAEVQAPQELIDDSVKQFACKNAACGISEELKSWLKKEAERVG